MVAGSAVPLAHPVPNLRGYVRTPFTTPRMLVDVRGLSTGSKAVCPYTGRAFLVPGAYTYPAIDFSTSGRPSESSRSHYASVTRSSQLPVSTSIVELPYASPMVGRPGFVKSPYTMGREVVDVTGLPAGMEVRCPYTGRLFRVPPQ